MKALKLIILLSFFGGTVFSQTLDLQSEPKEETGVPVFEFTQTSHDFGEINQGDKVSHTFKFSNKGQAPLVISRVQTTCGCTVPEWPKQPILPGQSGEIAATFDSKGKMGVQNKVITIHSNASEPVFRLTLKSNVLQNQQNNSAAEN